MYSYKYWNQITIPIVKTIITDMDMVYFVFQISEGEK